MADDNNNNKEPATTDASRRLYYMWLAPFSRKIQLALEEKKLEHSLVLEKVWLRREEYFSLNPSGQVPVLVEGDGTTIASSPAIAEYLEDAYPQTLSLYGNTPQEKAEVRRLIDWFDSKFFTEVSRPLLFEKVYKHLFRQGTPSGQALRAGLHNMHTHLHYIGFLTERRNWLAGESLSMADLAAAAHISSLDYMGVVPWQQYPAAKTWYTRLKSRPSFRPLLKERIPGILPVAHYGELDW